jgi:hypothetical protein
MDKNRIEGARTGREGNVPALRQVKGNKGSGGVDGTTVNQLPDYLKQHHPGVQECPDELQQSLVLDSFSHLPHQFVVIDSIKKLFQVEIDHPAVRAAIYCCA